MNWFEQLEQKRKLLVGGVIVICLAMLLVTARRNVFSFDAFWHLRAGIDWLQHGLSPWVDHYSFTFNGEAIAGPAYIFQAILASLVGWFGLEPGFQVYRLISYGLLLSLFIVFLRKLRAPVLVYCLVLPMAVVLLQFRSLARPELLSYSFILLAVMLYHRAQNKLSASSVLPMIGLIFVWANYHTPIIGYIVFFGYFVDIAIQQIQNRAAARVWLRWFGWGIAIVAVGFLNPDFQHALLGYLSFAPEWKDLIQEYQTAIASFRYISAFYALIIITLATMVLLAWKRQFGLLLVCLLLTYNAIYIGRLVSPGGIVVLAAFAWVLSLINIKSKLRKLPAWQVRLCGVAALLIFIATLWTGVDYAKKFMRENQYTAVRLPYNLVDYMLANDIKGRIFNSYGVGGYLIYRLSPESKIYIDGRTNILYPLEHFYRFGDAGQSASVLREEIEKYDINLAVLVNMQTNFAVVHDSGVMGLDYVGTKYSLFKQDEPSIPVIGSLLANPACWESSMHIPLKAEHDRAKEILPEYSPVLPFYDTIMAYAAVTDKVSYLNKLPESQEWTDYSLRFIAHQSLNNGLYSMAVEHFLRIETWVFKDYLATALAYIHLGNWAKAEHVLDSGTKIRWPSMRFDDLATLYGLLDKIRQDGDLQLIDEEYIDRLGAQLGNSKDTVQIMESEQEFFCSGSGHNF